MRMILKHARRALFAGGVGVALLFGATSARAEARGPACNDPLADGACTTQSGCQKSCQFNYGAGSGSCSDGCCYCIWY